MQAAVRLALHARELHELAVGLDPELVVAWGMRTAIAAALWPLPCPMVFQHNDLVPDGPAGSAVRAAATRASLVIALSRAVAGNVDPRGRLGGRVVVVHPGVDVERFSASPPSFDPPTVLVLGAIEPWKRPDLALDAFALARRADPRVRLRFVGAPLEDAGRRALAQLRRRVTEEGLADAVEFTGQVDSPAHELAEAMCLLHCADREPFGLAVLEALASGRPAVVPDSAGPSEIVDGSCGIKYRPGDPHAAGEGLGRLLADRELAGRLGAGGRIRATRQFDLRSSQAAWAQVIHSVGRRPGRARADPSPNELGAQAISVVTVTHNSAGFLELLLASIERHLAGASVIVVDCASGDHTVEVARGFAGARLHALSCNLGFGPACNLGLAKVSTPVSALLNPDIELLDDSLLELARRVQRPGGERQLLAPLLLGPDGRREDSVHPLPGSWPELLGALLAPTLLPRPIAVPFAPWRAGAPRRVGWAVGAALIARTDTLRQLGPFNERTFLYGEDLDLGLRAVKLGLETRFEPRTRVLHHRAHATRPAFGGEAFDLLAAGRRDAVGWNLGLRGLLVDDLAQALTFMSRSWGKRVLGLESGRERRQLQALLRARRVRPRAFAQDD
jgi:N-acetylglucosaminyl-diphospho-decaprenol L-rhamnosyltransferase